MNTIVEYLPDVRPLLSEALRFHVQSRSRPDIWHLVDLGETEGFRCGCETAQFRHAECHHVERAQKCLAMIVTNLIVEERKKYETQRKTQTPRLVA